MVSFVLAVHVFLHKVTALVLKVLAVQGQQLGEQAGIHLFPQFVDGVTIDEVALPGGLRV